MYFSFVYTDDHHFLDDHHTDDILNFWFAFTWNSWDEDVVGMIEQKDAKNKILVSFECQTLKAEKAAEDHIRQFMPKLAGLDAVGMLSNLSRKLIIRCIHSQREVFYFGLIQGVKFFKKKKRYCSPTTVYI